MKHLSYMLMTLGTGITLYCANGTLTQGGWWSSSRSVNVTLDGKKETSEIVLLDELNKPNTTLSFYDRQSLPYGNHQVTVLIVEEKTPPWAAMVFDYALVNDTIPSQRSLVLVFMSHKVAYSQFIRSSNAGAAAGGVVGGLAVLGMIAGTFIIIRRKRARHGREITELDPEPKQVILNSTSEDEENSYPVLPSPNTPVTMSQTNISNRSEVDTLRPVLRERLAEDTPDVPTPILTDDQIDSAAMLLSTGVRATDVARMMESLRAEKLAGAQESRDDDVVTVLPSYESYDGVDD